MVFTYKDLLLEMEKFCNFGVETGNIGQSVLDQCIPYVFVGKKGGNCLVVQGGIHAREHLTSLLVVCLAKHLVKNSHLLVDGGIYFVPMVNPDGVCLCQPGVDFAPHLAKQLVKINGKHGKDFSLWKANVRGVDLNVNFPANWGKGTSNVFEPSWQNYVGQHPCSEPETKALVDFTNFVKPVATLSYHLKGEEIYWEFGQTGQRLERDKRLAHGISRYTGYSVCTPKGSVGGYKDWCVQSLGIPSFTVEVGSDKFSHPFPYSQFATILKQNLDLPRRLLNSVARANKTQ